VTTNVKIVADAEPNADGEWINVPASVPVEFGNSWIKSAEFLTPFIPEGFHIVALGGTTRTPPLCRFANLDFE
jgi:hypothetical protein